MHFLWVCAVEEPSLVHSLMWPYEEGPNDYEDEWVDYVPFRDRYEIWGRWAWIIKLKDWCKGYDNDVWWYWTWAFDSDRDIGQWRCSVAQKKDIEYFYKWEKENDAYPHSYMYFDSDWEPRFEPQEWKRDSEKEKFIKKSQEEIDKEKKS